MMNYKDYLTSFGIEMTDKDWEIYEPRIFVQAYKKNDFIIEKGEVENHLSLITTGIGRCFLNKKEKEIPVNFLFENDYLTSYESFLTREPSKYSIQAMTDMVLLRATHDSFLHFFEHSSIGNFLGRISAEALYLSKARRELSLLTESAEERYLKLLKTDKNLLQKVPLKYIASSIGVTTQTLSRIRKRIN